MTGSTNAENPSAWLELESDPGLFTLLVDDFGVRGVQVEEIYDLSKTLDDSIFGFIFLFKWMERKGRRNKAASLDPNSNYVTDPEIVNKIFFAHQIVPNSCATHALLSILLNCRSDKYFDLGAILTRFQRLCDGLTPENKGVMIGNQPKLADAHNSYAKPENQSNSSGNQINDSPYASSSSTASSSMHTYSTNNFTYPTSTPGYNTGFSKSLSASDCSTSNAEIFHFICFVPISGRLYELDGLKPFPVDHGPLDTDPKQANWTIKFKSIIRQRLSSFNSGQNNHEIRFNLMALVPDKMIQLGDEIDLMKFNAATIGNMLAEVRGLCLNENDLNCVKNESGIKTELIHVIKKESELELGVVKSEGNATGSEVKPNTRQLRSSRVAIHKETNVEGLSNNGKSEQFEVTFLLDGGDDETKKKNLELCKLYRVDSIKYLTAVARQQLLIDPKEKENEIITNIKTQLNKGENQHIRDQIACQRGDMLKRYCDLAALKALELKLSGEILSEEARYNEELDKRKNYKIDALRRKHVYDEFIVTYLKILNENGKLAELIRSNVCQVVSSPGSAQSRSPQQSTAKRRKK